MLHHWLLSLLGKSCEHVLKLFELCFSAIYALNHLIAQVFIDYLAIKFASKI
jgi:hypothetical protein